MLPSEFVACTNHSLNLACLHAACTAIDSLTFFGTIEKLFSFFKFFHASMGCSKIPSNKRLKCPQMPYKTKFFAKLFHVTKRCANTKSCYGSQNNL